ncbi:NAD(P)-binding protein [Pleurotus eryngii]|uniref:NAD(P)-binding protein n=1 Tax=Pleurotus eryngii TaxID=5323 RepID=A0A9P6D3C7_PLEER|nr:NAD(P)-binding protein [Pleurotus eryngii]
MSKPFRGRIAIVGTGSRAAIFVRGIVERPESSRVVALCEPNTVRVAYYNDLLKSLALEVGGTCVWPAYRFRVLTEKPIATDVDRCRRILDAVNRTNSHITMSFNYRYNPIHELIKRTIAEGKIGKVLSVHFKWPLDTVHRADYFRRWHRQENSGGLTVHKSGHHFDLVSYWIDAEPVTVAAMRGLTFYGDKAGKEKGWTRDYERARGSEAAKSDPFAINLEADHTLKKIYADAESVDGYNRDQNVFAPGIGIEDDTAYSPWEGYRVNFNGSQGRLELESTMDGLIHETESLPHAGGVRVTLQNPWQKPTQLPVKVDHGSHGGGDTRMLSVLFGPLPAQAVDQGDAAKQGPTERRRAGAGGWVVGE